MRRQLLAGLGALLLSGCPSSYSPLNVLEPTPLPPPVPSGAGVFETFESGTVANVWAGGAGAPDAITFANTIEDAYSGTHSIKYVVSVNDPAVYPGLWGSVGHDFNSSSGIINAPGATKLSFRCRASAAFQLFPLLFEASNGGPSCAEGGTAEAWKWAPFTIPASTGWQKVSLDLSAAVPHIKNACVNVNGALDPTKVKTLEFGFMAVTFPLNATIFVDDIVFE